MMLPIYCRGVLCTLTLCLSLITTHSTAQTWQPWGQPATPHQHSTNTEPLNPLKVGVRFFQRYISVVDSPRCPMYPTCSAYAIQALDKHGAALGSFITVDRLLHEGNPSEKKHPITGYGQLRFYDPLSANDFWLTPTAID